MWLLVGNPWSVNALTNGKVVDIHFDVIIFIHERMHYHHLQSVICGMYRKHSKPSTAICLCTTTSGQESLQEHCLLYIHTRHTGMFLSMYGEFNVVLYSNGMDSDIPSYAYGNAMLELIHSFLLQVQVDPHPLSQDRDSKSGSSYREGLFRRNTFTQTCTHIHAYVSLYIYIFIYIQHPGAKPQSVLFVFFARFSFSTAPGLADTPQPLSPNCS